MQMAGKRATESGNDEKMNDGGHGRRDLRRTMFTFHPDILSVGTPMPRPVDGEGYIQPADGDGL